MIDLFKKAKKVLLCDGLEYQKTKSEEEIKKEKEEKREEEKRREEEKKQIDEILNRFKLYKERAYNLNETLTDTVEKEMVLCLAKSLDTEIVYMDQIRYLYNSIAEWCLLVRDVLNWRSNHKPPSNEFIQLYVELNTIYPTYYYKQINCNYECGK